MKNKFKITKKNGGYKKLINNKKISERTSRKTNKRTSRKTSERISRKINKRTSRKTNKRTSRKINKKNSKYLLRGGKGVRLQQRTLRIPKFGKVGNIGRLTYNSSLGTMQSLSKNQKIRTDPFRQIAIKRGPAPAAPQTKFEGLRISKKPNVLLTNLAKRRLDRGKKGTNYLKQPAQPVAPVNRLLSAQETYAYAKGKTTNV